MFQNLRSSTIRAIDGIGISGQEGRGGVETSGDRVLEGRLFERSREIPSHSEDLRAESFVVRDTISFDITSNRNVERVFGGRPERIWAETQSGTVYEFRPSSDGSWTAVDHKSKLSGLVLDPALNKIEIGQQLTFKTDNGHRKYTSAVIRFFVSGVPKASTEGGTESSA